MATEIKKTVNDILQIISDLRGESSVNTNASRIRAVSRAQKDFAKRKFWRFCLLPNQTVAGSGVNSYTIGSTTYPMRYKGLMELFVGGTTEDKRYLVVDYAKFKNLYNRDNNSKIAYEWFDVVNDAWKVYINPAPSASDTITYSYFWEPAAVTLTTDAVVVPNPDIIARLALAYIYEGEDDEKYINQLQIAEGLIREEEGHEEAPAVNQLYAMEASENSIRNQGFGTY